MMLRRKHQRQLLRLSVLLGSLCMLVLYSWRKVSSDYTYKLRYRWLEYTDYDGGPERVCNCSGILRGEREALAQAKLLTITKTFTKSIKIQDDYYINATKDCRNFKLRRKYLTIPLSQEEEDFPLAFTMTVHHKVHNFERLLRAIYAPQNVYCVHVDKKANATVHLAIRGITSCFPNVFIVSQAVSVVYSSWSRVQADLNCMADLYNNSTKWKYFINLCGQDFPLKTNLEMVRAVRALKGGNSLESETMGDGKKWRIRYSFSNVDGILQSNGTLKTPPPLNIPVMSGNAYIVVSRGFIQSVLEDKRVLALMEWSKDTYSPDEFLWATIQRLPNVPGSTRPNPKYDISDMTAIARLVKWAWHEGSEYLAAYPECKGEHVRSICVYGAGDVQWLLEQHHLFANKFDIEKDPIAVHCLEKYLRKKALAESNTFDTLDKFPFSDTLYLDTHQESYSDLV